MKLIFENLISNAIKFSESNTKIHISSEQDQDRVVVKIADEGPGILPSEVPLLFEKFTKLSARPTDNESSTGLGLSLVKYYSEQIGGNVEYLSDGESKGATFAFSMKLEDPKTEKEKESLKELNREDISKIISLAIKIKKNPEKYSQSLKQKILLLRITSR